MKASLVIIFSVAIGVSPSQCLSQKIGVPSHWGQNSGFGVSFAFSHSGKIVALSDDTGLAFMDMRSKRIFRSFSMPQSYCGYRQMVFAPGDSALFIVMCQSYEAPENSRFAFNPYTRGISSILLCNLRSGNLIAVDSDLHDCKIAFATNGTRFAELTSSGELSLHKIGVHSALFSVQMPPRREWPSEYTISFSADGSKLVAYWYGQLLIYDAGTLGSRVYLEDSLEWSMPEALGSTLFLSRNPQNGTPILIDIQTGREATIQPPFLNAQYKYMWMAPVTRTLHPVGAAIVDNRKYLLARYEVLTTGVPFEGGPRAGVDSLLITPLAHPELKWGLGIDPTMEISYAPSTIEPSILLSNGNTIMLLSLRTHAIDCVFKSKK